MQLVASSLCHLLVYSTAAQTLKHPLPYLPIDGGLPRPQHVERLVLLLYLQKGAGVEWQWCDSWCSFLSYGSSISKPPTCLSQMWYQVVRYSRRQLSVRSREAAVDVCSMALLVGDACAVCCLLLLSVCAVCAVCPWKLRALPVPLCPRCDTRGTAASYIQ